MSVFVKDLILTSSCNIQKNKNVIASLKLEMNEARLIKFFKIDPLDRTSLRAAWRLSPFVSNNLSSVHIYWQRSQYPPITSKIQTPAEQGEHVIRNLKPETSYRICIASRRIISKANLLIDLAWILQHLQMIISSL